MAASLCAVALVPALKLMGESLTLGREVETRNLLTTLGVSKLEQQLARSAASWTSTNETGSFAAEGFAAVRYQLTCSDLASDGGLPDQLMAVRVVVWEDADGDAACDSDELQLSFRSKIAKLALYEDEATGG